MEKKKHPHADLEKKRFVLFQVGLVVAMSVSLLAFEWTTSTQSSFAEIDWTPEDIIEIEDVPITRARPPEIPKEKKVEKKKSQTIVPVVTVVEFTDPLPEVDVDLDDLFDPDLDNPPSGGDAGPVETVPFLIVENMPCFCECADLATEDKRQDCSEKVRRKYLENNTKYPWDARQNKKEGKVYVSFVIDANGQMQDVQLANKVHHSLDMEALRVVSNMPCYSPGKQRGKKVPVRFTMPINFRLQ